MWPQGGDIAGVTTVGGGKSKGGIGEGPFGTYWRAYYVPWYVRRLGTGDAYDVRVDTGMRLFAVPQGKEEI